MKKITRVPDAALTRKSTEVKEINEAVKQTINDLLIVTEQVDKPFKLWLGMAAPQIGVNKRIFILRNKYKNYHVFINPQIISKKFLTPAVSKCYSVSGVYFPTRYFFVTVKYLDLEGKEIKKDFFAGKSWVVQHEIDHLNGVLASDYPGISA